ncbi:MAG: hypothetical protein QM784_11195 [Polyangiaceae bacterium]
MVHVKRALLSFVSLMTLTLGIACSSSDDEDSGTATGTSTGTTTGSQSGPKEALADHDCFLGLSPSGVSYTGYACSGTSQSSTVSGIGPKSFDDIRMTIWMDFSAPPALGRLELERLTVDVPQDDDTKKTWEADVTACTATATDKAEDTDMGWVYYQIDVDCAEAAAPAEGNTDAPLELGKFSVVTFFAP